MKGIIFQLLEDVVVDAFGEATWDELLDAAGLDGVYTSLGSYDDAEISALVSAAAAKLSLSEGNVLRWFGQRAIPGMAKRWPEFFIAHQTTMPFLLSLNDVIHPEVRKLYSGAYCPNYVFSTPPDGSVTIG
jgi:NADPH:quinone reductase-like Zn-dependent oxidoreductase